MRSSGIACAGSCNNRWSQPVPRALEEPHIAENIDLFDFSLSDEEMRRISALRKRNIRIAARASAEMGCRDGRLNARPAPICRFSSRELATPKLVAH